MTKKYLLGVLSLLAFNVEASRLESLIRGNFITGEQVFTHLKALEDIASRYNVTRAAGTEGHELSGNYIAQQLLAAGYKVELQPFQFKKYTHISGALSLASPGNVTYVEEKDFNIMTYSASGAISAPLVAVDIALGAGNNSTSGCEKADFENFPAGAIALVQRGTCAFADKVMNAQAAGAQGVIIFNQGNTPDREALFQGTLSEDAGIKLAVAAVPYQIGAELAGLESPIINLQAETKLETKTSFNVIAESHSGNPDNVVMLGAHLDSVDAGPGINDNGSGSAAILQVALKLKNVNTRNKLRFGWFSAEELGLIGSEKYVAGLSEEQKKKLALYINADMVGSPNYKLSVFDGDGSKFGQKGPEGSAQIEQLIHNFYSAMGVQSVETELNGRSDYAAFSAAGIAVGGIFTGAEGLKTEEEAKLFGGKAGEAYDACYHKRCDDTNNISIEALGINGNALAFLSLSLGHNAEKVRSENKMASHQARVPVVFPKHGDCHGNVHHE